MSSAVSISTLQWHDRTEVGSCPRATFGLSSLPKKRGPPWIQNCTASKFDKFTSLCFGPGHIDFQYLLLKTDLHSSVKRPRRSPRVHNEISCCRTRRW